MSTALRTLQVLTITITLLGAGGIASYSAFCIPVLRSQPASHSLPSTRWLFSRGSHIFPQISLLTSLSFLYLARASLLSGASITSLLRITTNAAKVNGFLAAAALALSIAPFTAIIVVPNNFALIEMNEKKGGARSQASEESSRKEGGGSAEDSVSGKGQAAELTDLSDPQGRTRMDSSKEEDERAREMLGKFGRQNYVRAGLLGAGGVVGLWAALLP